MNNHSIKKTDNVNKYGEKVGVCYTCSCGESTVLSQHDDFGWGCPAQEMEGICEDALADLWNQRLALDKAMQAKENEDFIYMLDFDSDLDVLL